MSFKAGNSSVSPDRQTDRQSVRNAVRQEDRKID